MALYDRLETALAAQTGRQASIVTTVAQAAPARIRLNQPYPSPKPPAPPTPSAD